MTEQPGTTTMATDVDRESMLTILDEPFVFTQRAALPVHNFGEELRKRKVAWPDEGQLEAFHCAGLLVPVYAISYSPALIRSRAKAEGRSLSRNDIRGLLDFVNTYGYGLIEERGVGDLRSPTADGYVPWRQQSRTFGGRPYRTQQYLYSYYQLLAAPMIERLWPLLRRRRGGIWRLQIPPRVLEHYQAEAAYYARLVRPLTLLEAVYLPNIVENVSMPGFDGFDEWDRFRATFDAAATLERIGWSAEAILKNAEGLLARAKGLDPAGAWHELTRLVHPSFWKKLEGTARTAIDYRIAGELFLQFYEDLARSGAAPPLEPLVGRSWHPRLERLKTDRSELDATLTHFGLSPHPAVVLIVEGEVEYRILPMVLDLLFERRWRSRVRLFNAQGVDQKLGSLAAFAAVPAVTDSERDVIPLARHPTRFVVLSDAEGSNADADARERKRQKWIERIHQDLPSDVRHEIDLSELDGLVRIIVWDDSGYAFEHAHFTDEELADGLLAIAPNGPPRAEVMTRLAEARRKKRNLNSVWWDWAPPQPAKPALAMELWPILSGRVKAARETGSAGSVPVLRAVREVMEIARQFQRNHAVVLRRRNTADPDA